MRIVFTMIICILYAISVQAQQVCKSDSIPASTPDTQLHNNNDGTVTDIRTGLMWKKCLEGMSGELCDTGIASEFTWQQAFERVKTVNSGVGFAGFHNWRLPNIKELISIVEEQCCEPAINLNRFPNTPTSGVWSSSPYAYLSNNAWKISFYSGFLSKPSRESYGHVRLVRGGQ